MLRIVAEIKLPSNWDAVHRPASRGVLNLRQTFITENIVAASALRQSCIVSGFIEQPRPFAHFMQNRKNGKSVFAQSIFDMRRNLIELLSLDHAVFYQIFKSRYLIILEQ